MQLDLSILPREEVSVNIWKEPTLLFHPFISFPGKMNCCDACPNSIPESQQFILPGKLMNG